MFSNGLVDKITCQTNLYATQSNSFSKPATNEEMKDMFAVPLLSGCIKVPYCEAVSQAISRNKYLEILFNLHLRDNSQMGKNQYSKV